MLGGAPGSLLRDPGLRFQVISGSGFEVWEVVTIVHKTFKAASGCNAQLILNVRLLAKEHLD